MIFYLEGLLELVSSATKEPDIAEQLYSLVAEEKSKGVSRIFIVCSLVAWFYTSFQSFDF